MDFLLRIRKAIHPLASRLGLQGVGRLVFRPLLRARYGKAGLAEARQNGRTWKLHPDVALRGEYAEFETIEWLRSVVRTGDCVIDVGANVGQMTLEAAELVGPAGKVVAVEPAAGNLRMLRDHVAANGFAGRVDVVPAACGDAHGTQMTFHIVGGAADAVGSGHSAVAGAVTDAPSTVRVTVPVVSLDALCRERGLKPAVLKVDVEGAELDVLCGAREILSSLRPQVRFGFHPFAFDDPAAATREIRALLDACGYDAPAPSGEAYGLDEYVPQPRGDGSRRPRG